MSKCNHTAGPFNDREGPTGTAAGIPSQNQRGIALVITLLVVALITAMVVEFAYGVFVSTSSLHNWQTSQKLSVAARSATKLAGRLISSGLLEKTKSFYEISQKIPYDDPEGTITVRLVDESSKFNLNVRAGRNGILDRTYSYPAMIRLFRALDLSTELADRVIWWINPRAMSALGPPEAAKDAPLDSVDELLLIPGMDKESYGKLLPYVTISGSSGLINMNTADVPVLMSLSEQIKKAEAEQIVSQRELNPIKNPASLGYTGLGGYAFGTDYQGGGSFKVTVTAESAGIRRVIEAVLDGGIIKFWRES